MLLIAFAILLPGAIFLSTKISPAVYYFHKMISECSKFAGTFRNDIGDRGSTSPTHWLFSRSVSLSFLWKTESTLRSQFFLVGVDGHFLENRRWATYWTPILLLRRLLRIWGGQCWQGQGGISESLGAQQATSFSDKQQTQLQRRTHRSRDEVSKNRRNGPVRHASVRLRQWLRSS